MSRALSVLSISALLALGWTVHAQQGTPSTPDGTTTAPQPGGTPTGTGGSTSTGGSTMGPSNSPNTNRGTNAGMTEVSCVNAMNGTSGSATTSAQPGTSTAPGTAGGAAGTTTGGSSGSVTGGTGGPATGSTTAGGSTGGTNASGPGTTTGGTSGTAGGTGGTGTPGSTGGTGSTTSGTTSSASGTTGSAGGSTTGTARANTLANLNTNDVCFLDKAARSNLFEIRSSQLALQSSNANVKKIATQLISDHTRATTQLAQLVARFGARLPAQPSAAQQTMLKTLQGQKGATFDATYLAQQVAAHTEAINMFRQYSQQARDASIRQFAAQQLPALQAHLRQVQQAQSQLGKK
ncbi:DUF4142 domain-containing protein [Deinococcus maricopensis]|uniref:DUF4142 domain-containing protein n=1 Tax=Deinococcus maricopensis (strain DSM 21211 / LMG 22137 / NRRL B-23946 / LB-34) TaxID=709986 RepID=E8U3S7_DEIML|nr:DUF4142 domain-containing protein [Deinococcus maricopensis]ADV68770.1 hypothetical protein Deima_3141 [Deinococcus maricopensis DSM 21211]